MERLIKQTLQTLSKVGQSERLALLHLQDEYHTTLLGGLFYGNFVLNQKNIPLKGTPLEAFVQKKITSRSEVFPAVLVEDLPFPVEDNNGIPLQCLCLPWHDSQGVILGFVLMAQESGNYSMPFYNLHIIERLIPLIAASFEIAFENNFLEKSVMIDNHTGLHTRNYFETRLQEEFSRTRRHGGYFSLLLLEVDNFNKLTELIGLNAVKKLIQSVAKLIDKSIRNEIDIPCRYNTSQFILLLPNTNADGAMIVAERIREKCGQHIIKLPNQRQVKLTVSIGIAHNMPTSFAASGTTEEENAYEGLSAEELSEIIEDSEISKEDLVYRVDLMLNAAKQAGHNKVMVWW